MSRLPEKGKIDGSQQPEVSATVLEIDGPAEQDVDSSEKSSPVVDAKSPEKWVVFRSKDKELVLFHKAGYMDKSHGIATYTPTEGVKFQDHMVRILDVPENSDVLEWLRKHPSNGISFRKIPDMSNAVELPTISEMKLMTMDELVDLCEKNAVKVPGDAQKDSIILALIEKK